MKMQTLVIILIDYWFWFAIVMSSYWGIRGLHMSLIKKWKDKLSKTGYFYWLSYQFIFNFVGSFAGWFCFYALLIRTQNDVFRFRDFTGADIILFVISLLGLTGHIPQVLYGLIEGVSMIGKMATEIPYNYISKMLKGEGKKN